MVRSYCSFLDCCRDMPTWTTLVASATARCLFPGIQASIWHENNIIDLVSASITKSSHPVHSTSAPLLSFLLFAFVFHVEIASYRSVYDLEVIAWTYWIPSQTVSLSLNFLQYSSFKNSYEQLHWWQHIFNYTHYIVFYIKIPNQASPPAIFFLFSSSVFHNLKVTNHTLHY